MVKITIMGHMDLKIAETIIGICAKKHIEVIVIDVPSPVPVPFPIKPPELFEFRQNPLEIKSGKQLRRERRAANRKSNLTNP